jgi:asparagine synthase (glutamine-hydrolysing)
MSMAVGLEVRVPFCDHRLVDYVFNIPWRLKTFDGREKSILRAATRELLPESIVERQKNPYPSTQDPAYEKALRANVAEIVEDQSHPATPLLKHACATAGQRQLPPRPLRPRAGAVDQHLGEGLWRRAESVIAIPDHGLDPGPGTPAGVRAGGAAAAADGLSLPLRPARSGAPSPR